MCTRDRLGSKCDVVAESSCFSTLHSSGECSQLMSAPLSKSQRRLHRRRMAWLAYVAYDRAILLQQRTKTSSAKEHEEPLSKHSMLRTVVDTFTARNVCSEDLPSVFDDAEADKKGVSDRLPDSIATNGLEICPNVHTDMVVAVEALGLEELLACCHPLCLEYENAIAAMERIASLLTSKYELREEDWLPVGTVATMIDLDLETALIIPFCDKLAKVLQCHRRSHEYEVLCLPQGKCTDIRGTGLRSSARFACMAYERGLN
eukprot:TRINITY_DN17621_c0_g1_i1.p1 TRINITY_DN17621_c0_g1~~TRINITY_DN17621_c0_g1_i1.p1  ORF type:complete len:261 (+),score=28.09 TRINITY_DN17621_c0_g1_i1:73-855(+)